MLKVLAIMSLVPLVHLNSTRAYAQEPTPTELQEPNASAETQFLTRSWVETARQESQPPMLLPWEEGTSWSFSSGPHAGYIGSDFAAIDLAPPSSEPCYQRDPTKISHEWVLSSTPGVVASSQKGEVVVDLDGDGNFKTGWSAFYFHMSDTERIKVGTTVYAGDKLGRVDCMWGRTDGTHLHFARRRNGQWVNTNDDRAPMDLSGWTFGSDGVAYQGWAIHTTRGQVPTGTALLSDNGPQRRSEVFGNQPALADLGWLFKLPLPILKPGPIVKHPEVMGAFVNGRLKGKNDLLLPVASKTHSSEKEEAIEWDLSTSYGAPVRPAASGRIEYGGCNNAEGRGCWLKIRHPSGYSTIYTHLINERDPKFEIQGRDAEGDPAGFLLVREGQEVSQWDVIGRVGSTGETGWTHVRFEVRGADGKQLPVSDYFDPTEMEHRPKGDPLDWEWDEPYQLNNPMMSLTPFLGRISSRQLEGGTSLILVLLFILFVYLKFVRGRPVRRGPWWWEIIKIGVFTYVAMLMVAFLFAQTTKLTGVNWILPPQLRLPTVNIPLVFAAEIPVKPGTIYAGVWGWPCTNAGPGTLGKTCTSKEIVAAAQKWANEVAKKTGKQTIPVAIPVVSASFDLNASAKLLQEAHRSTTLVVVDTSGKTEKLREAIRELTPHQLDGIVVDHEHNQGITFKDLKELGTEFASAREQAGLKQDGILLVWDVFHNLQGDSKDFNIPGIYSVAANDGFGSTTAKSGSLAKTQDLFGVNDNQLGLMFFDQRWPVNRNCQGSSNSAGYDCQPWTEAYDNIPKAQELSWLLQQ